jgi:lipopolysaccharide transport system ATP-binding protein
LLAALRKSPEHAVVPERIHAVDGISLTVREGERVGIIGRNGAGKSTLLHMIAGLVPADEGKIEISGNLHAVLTLGMVLREETTGRENIHLDATIQESDATADMVQKVIDFAELGDFIDRPVHTYSSGMKARLAFAMVAFIEPEILIIDEVLSVGDFHFSAKATRRMRELANSGRIVIVVSHGLGSIVEMCNRCLWIDHGRIVMDGDPAEVVAAYESEVQEQDAASLKRKFDQGLQLPIEANGCDIRNVRPTQPTLGDSAGVSLKAMQETVFDIVGSGTTELSEPDLQLSISRIDDTLMWQDRAGRHCDAGVLKSAFQLRVKMDPLMLGEGLYRVDAVLQDGLIEICGRSAVFEINDEEGQIGGRPMLYYPPSVRALPSDEPR